MPARVLPEPTGDAIADLAALLESMTPVELDRFLERVPRTELPTIERVLARRTREGWRANPLTMARHLTRKVAPDGTATHAIEDYAYTRLLAQKFVDAVELRSPRQIWNLPSRYGKSTLASRYGPAWALDQRPDLTMILASWGDRLAQENAVFVRDFLIAHGDVLRTRLKRDRRERSRFVTEQGGGIIAAGIGAGLAGLGGLGAIVDDPFKNWADAHSEARREEVWDWFRSTLYLRMDQIELSFIIVPMTRWHEDDLTGKLEQAMLDGDGDKWEIVRLPALAEDDDILGRTRGEPLEPKRFPMTAVQQRARTLGSYLAAGLEQQRPAPEEGTDIMRGWWKWYDAAPAKFDAATTSWDMKLKDSEKGDYVVGLAMGRTGGDYWILDELRGQWNEATTKVAIALMQVRYPWIRRHVIENTGNGPEVLRGLRRKQPGYTISMDIRGALGMLASEVAAVEALLRRGMSGLLPENPKGTKRIRMRARVGLIESGNVHLPANRDWALSLVNEAATFPNGSFDDQVDALSQGLKRLEGLGTAKVERPTGKVPTPPPGRRAPRAQVVRPGRMTTRRGLTR